MSLVAAGEARSRRGARTASTSCARSVRDDGSWPIDTNLATWVTTLSINALAAGGPLTSWLDDAERATLRRLAARPAVSRRASLHARRAGRLGVDRSRRRRAGRRRHGRRAPRAGASAARRLAGDARVRDAAAAGVRWLLDLQNRDGGMPTFCRGWTGLPFDRSGPDLTAHAVRAWCAWRPHLASPVAAAHRRRRSTAAGRYLAARPARRRRLRAARGSATKRRPAR